MKEVAKAVAKARLEAMLEERIERLKEKAASGLEGISDDLGQGRVGMQWSHPSGGGMGAYDDGMVWYGSHPPTDNDYLSLYHYMTSSPESTWTLEDFFENVHFDVLSLVGRWHPDWSSGWEKNGSTGWPKGGLGSECYEKQRIAPGVDFFKKDSWYWDKEGNMVKGMPGTCGEHHEVHMGDTYYDSFEGPAPGSFAEAQVAGSHYYWDDENKWYAVENPNFEIPLPPAPDPERMKCQCCGKKHPDF